MRARNAALVGVALALMLCALAVARRRTTTELAPAVESTLAVRIVRRDRTGLPEKKGTLRDPARVRTITAALGIDVHGGGECPPDYADADFGLVLSGASVYDKRNVYVFGLLAAGTGTGTGTDADADADAGAAPPSVVSVTSAGCRVGPPADVAALRRELRTAGTLD